MCIEIPQISDEELIRLYARLKPIVTVDGHKYWLREFLGTYCLKDTSYLWRVSKDIRDRVDMSTIVAYPEDFMTLHQKSFYDSFKPTIAEIYAQLIQNVSEEILNKAVAFEMVRKPMNCDDNVLNPEAFDQGYYAALIRLYFPVA